MVIRRHQLVRCALLTVEGTVGQRGADRRVRWQVWCEKALLLLGHLSLRLALLFPLGAPVLEPDLHLSLGEAQGRGDAVTLEHWQVMTSLEAVLQHLQLLQRERGADPTPLALGGAPLSSARRHLLRPAASTCCWRMRHRFVSGGISWKPNSQTIHGFDLKAKYVSLNTSSESLTCLTICCWADSLCEFCGIQNILHRKRRSVGQREFNCARLHFPSLGRSRHNCLHLSSSQLYMHTLCTRRRTCEFACHWNLLPKRLRGQTRSGPVGPLPGYFKM